MLKVLVAIFISISLTTGPGKAQNPTSVSQRVQSTLTNLVTGSLENFVTDTVIRKFIRNGPSPYGARMAIFEESVCVPILGPASIQGHYAECRDVIYHTYNQSSLNLEANPIYGLEKTSLPRSMWNEFSMTRKVIMETAREFLRNPENLNMLYQAEVDILAREFRGMHKLDQLMAIDRLSTAVAAFNNFLGLNMDEYNPPSASRYGEGIDVYTTGFAFRRYQEGGKTLVEAWSQITQDLRNQLLGNMSGF